MGTRRLSEAAQSKLKAAEEAVLRAQAKLDEAVKECEELKEKGDHVPDDENILRAISAKDWNPVGIMAAKNRRRAKAALAKMLQEFEKASANATSREQTHDAAQAKLEDARSRRKAAEQLKSSIDCEIASSPLPKKLKAKPAGACAKARARGKGSQAKVIKRNAKVK